MRQNLVDAACPSEVIEQFMVLQAGGKFREQMALLAKHRKCLLSRVHQEQRSLDCLDYLLYTMQKQGRRNES